MARAITGHVTTRMAEHHRHVDAGEENAAVTGTLRLVRSVDPAPQDQDAVEIPGATESK